MGVVQRMGEEERRLWAKSEVFKMVDRIHMDHASGLMLVAADIRAMERDDVQVLLTMALIELYHARLEGE